MHTISLANYDVASWIMETSSIVAQRRYTSYYVPTNLSFMYGFPKLMLKLKCYQAYMMNNALGLGELLMFIVCHVIRS